MSYIYLYIYEIEASIFHSCFLFYFLQFVIKYLANAADLKSKAPMFTTNKSIKQKPKYTLSKKKEEEPYTAILMFTKPIFQSLAVLPSTWKN